MKSFIKKIVIIFSLCIFNFNVKAVPCINFDLNKQGLEQLNKYSNYRKCKGLKKAYLYDLPIVSKITIISDFLTKTDIENVKNHLGNNVFCRFDAPANKWYGLPRGQDLKVEDINDILQKTKKINPSAILLCFEHPSKYFVKKIVERPYISGGLSILIDWNKSIIIEYVGQGFDAGEITRGKNNCHCSIVIPWEISNWPTEFIWQKVKVQTVSVPEYIASRQRRINFLKTMGYFKEELENCIPNEIVPTIDKDLFKNIFENCIKKVIKYPQNFNTKNSTVIMGNMYNDKIHVVEIWNSNL